MDSPHVTVYGNDHSPWVQAVLLGLHDRGIPHTLVTVPPLRVFLSTGILMPAARIGDGPWLHDSAAILAEIGYANVAQEDARDLMRLFRSSAARRTDSTWTFWSRFSRSRDGHPRALRRYWNHFWRAFSIFYFYTLIKLAGSKIAPRDPEAGLKAMLSLQDRLGQAGPFLAGKEPDTADLQLFGLIQMCSSIPVPERAMLKSHPKLGRLRDWTSGMQQRFAAYDHLYSATDYPPERAPIRESSATERAVFGLGAATMWIAFPLTIPLVAVYVARVRRIDQRRNSAVRG